MLPILSVILAERWHAYLRRANRQGADSTQPTIVWAFILLAHRQDIQILAFNELQKATGYNYDPAETKDVDYILALVKEVLRFYTPLPLSMPRETTAPVQYKDAIIPSGTMVFLNAWACNHGMSLVPTYRPPLTRRTRPIPLLQPLGIQPRAVAR